MLRADRVRRGRQPGPRPHPGGRVGRGRRGRAARPARRGSPPVIPFPLGRLHGPATYAVWAAGFIGLWPVMLWFWWRDRANARLVPLNLLIVSHGLPPIRSYYEARP